MVCSGVMWLVVIVGGGFWWFWLISEDMYFHKNSGNEKWTLSIVIVSMFKRIRMSLFEHRGGFHSKIPSPRRSPCWTSEFSVWRGDLFRDRAQSPMCRHASSGPHRAPRRWLPPVTWLARWNSKQFHHFLPNSMVWTARIKSRTWWPSPSKSVLARYTLIIVCGRMQRQTSLDRLFHKVPRTRPDHKNMHTTVSFSLVMY